MIKFASALIAALGVANARANNSPKSSNLSRANEQESEDNRATSHLNLNLPDIVKHNMHSVHHAETFDRDHIKD